MAIVRALIVTDDWPGVADGGFLQWIDQASPESISAHARTFHLGEFVRVLTTNSWLGFTLELTKAHRAVPSAAENAAQIATRTGADVVGFRFDQSFVVAGATRMLTDYDLVLFFPIDPQSEPAETALADEAAAIAGFMEQGGGFFASGDHEDLGAPLSRLIPRVRSMRRWWYDGDGASASGPGPSGEPPAPSALGFDRHDTTQRATDLRYVFENQSDEVPQPLDLLWFDGGLVGRQGYIAHRRLPHPLLCSPEGAVTVFPDHMHEGWVEVPDDLAGRHFTLNGTTHAEYPPKTGGTDPLAPEVIASGRVVGLADPAIDQAHSSAGPADPVEFGIVCAWDGHLAGRGRVAVDSTWHHFFNINLTGDRFLERPGDVFPGTATPIGAGDQRRHGFFVIDPQSGSRVPNDAYRLIMWYYRNLVYWLIPAARRSGIIWNTLADIVRTPRLAEELSRFDAPSQRKLDPKPATDAAASLATLNRYFYFGQLAEQYFNSVRGACAVYTLRIDLYRPVIPWWEWIEEIVSIWNPIERQRANELGDLRQFAAAGFAADPEAIVRAGVGAAVIAVARLRRELPGMAAGDAQARLEAAWRSELGELAAHVRVALKRGIEVSSDFEARFARLSEQQL